MKLNRMILMMLITLLAVSAISHADFISGDEFEAPNGALYYTCEVDDPFERGGGFIWKYRLEGDNDWVEVGRVDKAIIDGLDLYKTKLKDPINEHNIYIAPDNYDINAYTVVPNKTIRSSNIAELRCRYRSTMDDLKYDFVFIDDGNTGDDYTIDINMDADGNLVCDTNAPGAMQWFKSSLTNPISGQTDNILEKEVVEPTTKYYCTVESPKGRLTAFYTTGKLPEISNIEVTCDGKTFVNNHDAVCGVTVYDEYGFTLEGATVDFIEDGLTKSTGVTNTQGTTTLRFNAQDIKTHFANVTASKVGYSDLTVPVTYRVVIEKYNITDFQFANESSFTNLKNEFFRTEDLYVSFKVYDKATDSYITENLDMNVSLIGSGLLDLTGSYDNTLEAFVYHVNIPIIDDFLTEKYPTSVISVAINDADMEDGGAQEEKNVTILNNLPVIDMPTQVNIKEKVFWDLALSYSDIEMVSADEMILSASNLPYGASFAYGKIWWTPKPEDVGSHDVTFNVTDRNGGYATHTMTIIVEDVITSVEMEITSPNPANQYKVGQAIDFNATIIKNDDDVPVTYKWNFPNGDVRHGNSSYTFNSVGDYYVVLEFTYDGIVDTSNFVIVSVGDLVTPTVEITNPVHGDKFGLNEDISFESTVVNNPDNLYISYVWNFDNNTTASGDLNGNTIKAYSEEGVYDVRLTYTSNGRERYDRVKIIASDRTCDVNIITPASNIIVNNGTNINFEAELVGFCPENETTWSIEGVTYTGLTATHTFNNIGNITATVNVSSFNGDASDSRNIEVIESIIDPCTIDIISPVSNITINKSDSVSFEAVLGGTCNNEVVTWSIEGETYNGLTATHTFNNIGNVTADVVVTTPVNGEDSDSRNIEVIEKIIIDPCTIDIISPGSDITINKSDSVSFEAVLGGTCGGENVTWSIEGQTYIGLTATHTFNNVGNFTANVNVYSLNGDDSDSVKVEVIDGIIIPDCEIKIIHPQASAKYINVSEEVNFHAELTGYCPNNVTTWTIDGNEYNGLSTLYTFNTAGTYDVSVNVFSDNNNDSDSVTVDVYDESVEYEIIDIKTYNISGMTTSEADIFYRGQTLIVAFKVVDKNTGDIIDNAPVTDVIVRTVSGTHDFGNFTLSAFAVSDYYVYESVIPYKHPADTQNYVVSIAIDNSNGMATLQKEITILNNLPTINIVSPEDMKTYNKTSVVPIVVDVSDKEDDALGKDLEVTFTLDGADHELDYFTNLSVGQHTLTATVEDADGASASHQVQFFISDNVVVTTKPEAIATVKKQSQDENGTVISFDASASQDTDNVGPKDIVSYEWIVEGTVYTDESFTLKTTSLEGKVSYELTVTDNEGETDTVSGTFVFIEDKDPVEIRDSRIDLPIKISRVTFGNRQIQRGSYARAYVVIENLYEFEKNDLEDLTLTVSIPSIGVSKSENFDLEPNEKEDFAFYLPVRSGVRKGHHTVKIDVHNDEERRTIYRSIYVR